MEDTKEYTERRITLTKEFHDTYWDKKLKYFHYAIICYLVFGVSIIIGVNAMLSNLMKLEILCKIAMLISIIFAVLFTGFSIGMSQVGYYINEQVKKEHPEDQVTTKEE
jgi:hypothetical protein